MPTLEAIRSALDAVITGGASETEHRLVRDELRAGRLVLAEGERSVAVGGSANGATIVTGNGNVVLMLDAAAAQTVRALIPRSDWLEKLIRIISTYFDHFLRLITGPKRFIAERVSKNDLEVRHALGFLGVSILFASTLTLAFHKGNPILISGVNILFNTAEAIAFGLCLCLAWRSVGGNASLRHMFSTTFYYAGIWAYIVTITNLLSLAILNEISAALYDAFYNSLYRGCNFSDLAKSIESDKVAISNGLIAKLGLYGALSLPFILGGLQVVPHTVWLFVGWGAYRQLNLSSRFRSCLAFALFLLFFAPVPGLLALVGLQVFRAFAQEAICQ